MNACGQLIRIILPASVASSGVSEYHTTAPLASSNTRRFLSLSTSVTVPVREIGRPRFRSARERARNCATFVTNAEELCTVASALLPDDPATTKCRKRATVIDGDNFNPTR